MPAAPHARPLPALRTPLARRTGWKVLFGSRPRTSTLTFAVAALLLANLALYVLTVVQEAGLNRVQAQIFAKRRENVRLRAELAKVEAPERIENRAVADLRLGHAPGALFVPALPSLGAQAVKVAPPTFGVPEAY
ncbi:MAG TPA: hypothetical protein V6D00_10780 [Pantanalinema sp.]